MPDVIVYYLEMLSLEQHHRKPAADNLVIEEAFIKQYRVNRMLYELIGENWQWNDKANWTDNIWKDYAESDSLRTWMARHRGSIAGYFELQQLDASTNELAYFGLAEKFIARGFGGCLLSEAVDQAWAWGDAERIIVNTCSLDHPNALANYQARGFTLYDEKTVADS